MNAEKLLAAVKQTVKLLVEEAVTRRFVHQDSANITALCVELDRAITFGLQPRFKRRWSAITSADILQQLGRYDKTSLDLSKKCQEIIAIVGQHNASSGFFSRSNTRAANGDRAGGLRQKLFANYSSALSHRGHERFLWIRIALMEKTLVRIVEQLVTRSSLFYEGSSLMGDPVNGPIVASLLAGPCALDYSRMKTPDHLFVDPSAEELVLKDRIASKGESTQNGTQHSLEKNCAGPRDESPTLPAKDPRLGEAYECITALHQNSHAALIYGKNNVLVETAPGHHSRGYLSVHQMGTSLLVKWTPNDLVTGKGSSADATQSSAPPTSQSTPSALTVDLSQVVCIHCHPYVASSGGEDDVEIDIQRVQLILQDGTSLPPIGLQHGSTLFTFLAMLETALLPGVRLDPPLWGQHDERSSMFAPPWPISKQRVAPPFTGLHHPVDGDNLDRSQPSLLNRKIEMSDLPNSLAGARQFNARQRLERGCIFHLVPTNREPSPSVSPPPEELFLHLSRDSDISSKDHVDPASQKKPAATLPTSVEPETPQAVSAKARKPRRSGNSIGDLNMTVMSRMKERIKSRTFYGWMMYCRDMRIVRNNLGKLLLPVSDKSRTVHVSKVAVEQWGGGLTAGLWDELMARNGVIGNPHAVMKYIFFGGVHDDKKHNLRKQVWPYLLGLYGLDSTATQRTLALDELRKHYETTLTDWLMVESGIKESNADELAQCEKLFAELPSRAEQLQAMWDYRETQRKLKNKTDGAATSSLEASSSSGSPSSTHSSPAETPPPSKRSAKRSNGKEQAKPVAGDMAVLDLKDVADDCCSCPAQTRGDDANTLANAGKSEAESDVSSTVITYSRCTVCGKPQQQERNKQATTSAATTNGTTPRVTEVSGGETERVVSSDHSTSLPHSYLDFDAQLDPVEIWSRELHKIDKDVMRCDRNYYYFVPANLVKLRNVIATYVWEHRPPVHHGYTQGMVDLLAPLMVVFDDEVMAYGCFCKFMDVMEDNFPHGKTMDSNFFNMRLLFEVYDRELFELMRSNGDYTHFFFSYRWYLLDLKRELVYDDIFKCWECIWAARHCCTGRFTLFLCTSLVHNYRDVILKNNMDFTEIIKFFNDMAEKHRFDEILDGAHDIVEYLQKLLLTETKDNCLSAVATAAASNN